MSNYNPNAPILFPRVEADVLAELSTGFADQLNAEGAISDRADLEPLTEETFGTSSKPVFQRTAADALAEVKEGTAWKLHAIIWNTKRH